MKSLFCVTIDNFVNFSVKSNSLNMDQIIDSIDGQIIYQDHKFFELNGINFTFITGYFSFIVLNGT